MLFFYSFLLAILIDAVVGDPETIYKRVWHPVVWFGKFISRLERLLYPPERDAKKEYRAGLKLVVRLVAVVGIGAFTIHFMLTKFEYGWVVESILASTLIAQRSLYLHVKVVAVALIEQGIEAGRAAVSMIVGRETKTIDEPAVTRAAIESCAENFSDGVVAPLFWYALLGLPGLAVYKAINTADSMIGHRNDHYENFGKVAARLDDVVNWPAARIAGCAVAISSWFLGGASATQRAFKVMFRDARQHRSPNAGWPEGAFSGALNIALAGPRTYDGERVDGHWVGGEGERNPDAAFINAALRLYVLSCAFVAVLFALAVFVGSSFGYFQHGLYF
jgi:adenosylcobinamide-phosphate synthase